MLENHRCPWLPVNDVHLHQWFHDLTNIQNVWKVMSIMCFQYLTISWNDVTRHDPNSECICYKIYQSQIFKSLQPQLAHHQIQQKTPTLPTYRPWYPVPWDQGWCYQHLTKLNNGYWYAGHWYVADRNFMKILIGRWWFFPTHLKNMLVKLDHLPEKKIQNIWNHHLVIIMDNFKNYTIQAKEGIIKKNVFLQQTNHRFEYCS